jgi:hypothetical protein
MARSAAFWSIVTAAGLAGCAGPDMLDAARLVERESAARLAPVSADERRALLARARIFDPVDTAEVDLAAGPPDPHAFGLDQKVSCDFLQPRPDLILPHGTTPKFFCTLRHHHDHALVKVKYGHANREPVGEVLGSRLLWALGVATDHDFPVKLRCHQCPRDPWLALRSYPKLDGGPRQLLEVDDAVLQRLYPGLPIEECTKVVNGQCAQRRQDQGWTFDELEALQGKDGRAELDALRLLAAFIAHGDDKPSNQRLVCAFQDIDSDGKCRLPRLLIADLGSTFGRGASGLRLIDGDSRPSFRAWSTLPLWQDRATCRAHLATRQSQANPIISEAGRQLLATKLAQLSDAQLQDLFTVARVESMGETLRDRDGHTRPVTVADWVQAFKTRRDDIVHTSCP